MNLPRLTDTDVTEKRVLVRSDVDVSLHEEDDEFRLKTITSTIKHLSDNKAKTIIIGHKGRPEGKVEKDLTLKPVSESLGKILDKKVEFIPAVFGKDTKDKIDAMEEGEIVMLENLRFDSGEEKNNKDFAERLAQLGDLYVNEAFGASHRRHASIVSLPNLLTHRIGFHFEKEIENLSKVFESPKGPVIVVIGGVKKDKLNYLEDFKKFADKILVGGRLPGYLDEGYKDEKVLVAKLNPGKEDLTINSIEKFEEEIKEAGTVVIAGPMGKYEEEGHDLATRRIFEAIITSSSFKVIGGGDTHAAMTKLGIAENKFDWVSSGGGAMLEFLAKETLPGLEALLN